MDGKSRVLLLVLALASTGLAGCIEAASFLNASDVEVSAFENKKLADEAALAWSKDAKLVSVMAFELSQSDEARIESDPEVGNGLAPAWWYVYCLETKDGGEVRAFKVAADGTVTSEDDAATVAAGYKKHEMTGSLSDWKVDSHVALDAAKADESFRKAAEGFNATLVEGVAHYEGHTTWWFAAVSADGFVVATVDAVTGKLLDVHPMDLGMTMPSFEWAARSPEHWVAEPVRLEGEGVAQPGARPLEMPFFAASAMHGELVIEYAQMLPTDGLRWAILDGDGEAVARGSTRSWRGGGSMSAEVAIEEAGQYTFVLGHHTWIPGPMPRPVANDVEYEFALELMPGHAAKKDR
ncbi:MAG TPA: hypothetical protein VM582_00755 [Candidatus Thermoplasmatota archaeon]|nr:hypothetical protein [Candidatus Thermoplasmatota archaeon]